MMRYLPRRFFIIVLLVVVSQFSPRLMSFAPAESALPATTLRQGSARNTAAFAFMDVNVITMAREEILPHQTVVISGSTIVAIGPVDQVPLPTAVTCIDGTDHYLLPGLADMHIHLRRQSYLLLLLMNGVTTVRNMDGAPIHLTWRTQITKGQRLGPTIFTTGPILDELPAHLPDQRPAATVEGAMQLVAEQKELGYDFIKVHDGLSGSAYRNIITAARFYNMPVVGHVPNSTPIMEVVVSGQESIEHLDGYFNLYTDQMPIFLDKLRQHHVWTTPTATCFQPLSATGKPPATIQQAMLTAMPTITTEFGFLPTDFAEKGYAYATISQNNRNLIALLYEAGAPLLLGTDAPFAYAVPGFAVHQELQNFVAAGLTPYAALHIATYEAARYLDRLDEFGTVTVGKRADLLLVTANPLRDVNNAHQIIGVMVQGRWLPKAELQRLLHDTE